MHDVFFNLFFSYISHFFLNDHILIVYKYVLSTQQLKYKQNVYMFTDK